VSNKFNLSFSISFNLSLSVNIILQIAKRGSNILDFIYDYLVYRALINSLHLYTFIVNLLYIYYIHLKKYILFPENWMSENRVVTLYYLMKLLSDFFFDFFFIIIFTTIRTGQIFLASYSYHYLLFCYNDFYSLFSLILYDICFKQHIFQNISKWFGYIKYFNFFNIITLISSSTSNTGTEGTTCISKI
jgi:hypothetical protein